MTDLKDILYSIGYTKLKDFGRQYSAKPLYRDSDNETALTINKDTGEWYDFVERVGGPLETLIEKTIGKPLTPDLLSHISSDLFLPTRREEVELPFQKVWKKECLSKLVSDHSYWLNRGVSNHTMAKFHGGIAIDGRMRNRYVFPIIDERGNIVGFSGRYLYPSKNVVRWKHLGTKSWWVYPTLSFPSIAETRTVILVESIGDMLSLYDAGVTNIIVTFGVKLSASVIKFLLKADARRIFISLNNDSKKNSVGNKAATEFFHTLRNYFDTNQIGIALPIKKDFGEMTNEEIILWKQLNQI
jgi:hypothetical protein